jgi:hypothetical protein
LNPKSPDIFCKTAHGVSAMEYKYRAGVFCSKPQSNTNLTHLHKCVFACPVIFDHTYPPLKLARIILILTLLNTAYPGELEFEILHLALVYGDLTALHFSWGELTDVFPLKFYHWL